jgi:hypothetical protein
MGGTESRHRRVGSYSTLWLLLLAAASGLLFTLAASGLLFTLLHPSLTDAACWATTSQASEPVGRVVCTVIDTCIRRSKGRP